MTSRPRQRASCHTAGLVLVQRAHAERLASVEVRARRGDRTSSGIPVYLVVGVALSAYAALVNGQP